MRGTEGQILNLFKESKRELCAQDIAKLLYPQEFSTIEEHLGSDDKRVITKAKAKKFQLQRKVLYYLNKLESEQILSLNHIEEKGEKYYTLAIGEGELIVEKGHKKIIVTKTALPSNHTDKYEQQKLIKRFDASTFVSHHGALFIDAGKVEGIHQLKNIINDCLESTNDSIGVYAFEHIITSTKDHQSFEEFITHFNAETLDQHKTLTITINPATLETIQLEPFIIAYSAHHPKRMTIIFETTTRDLSRKREIYERIIEHFAEAKIKINIKNHELHSAPYSVGRAGVYTLDPEEWTAYIARGNERALIISCTQSQVAFNMHTFLESGCTDAAFRTAALDAARTLLSANTVQRRKSGEYYRTISVLNGRCAHEFYTLSRNYIRFWNYNWQQAASGEHELLALLKSTKELVDHYCATEETIYKSCGIPIRFRIAFSSAFRHFDQEFQEGREYRKTSVRRIEEYYQKEIKEFIYAREQLLEIFDGGDRLRIFHSPESSPQEIIHEWNYLLSTCKIPFFTFDFSALQGTIKLTNFL